MFRIKIFIIKADIYKHIYIAILYNLNRHNFTKKSNQKIYDYNYHIQQQKTYKL